MIIDKGGLITLVLAALCWPGFFFASASSGGIVISEVAWAGSVESSYDEWIELANLSDAEVDLSGWVLEARDGSPKIVLSGSIAADQIFLLERTDDGSSPSPADMFYAGSLGNEGEYLELKDASGVVVDSFDASGGWPAGGNADKTTAQRCGSSWSSGPAGGTPGASNVCQDKSGEQLDPIDEGDIFRFGDLIINEFVSDPDSGEEEWLELYHPGSARLDLSGWTISDGSAVKTTLTAEMASGESFFVARGLKGKLNNSGDEIVLRSPDGNLIDRVVYGDWGSSTEQNAPCPGKGLSAALREDGRRLGLMSESFIITTEPTPGSPNKLVAELAPAEEESPASGELRITEVFPNPVGSDRENEFIEFKNHSSSEMDFAGWRLEIEGGKTLEFGKNFLFAPKVPPGSFFILWRKDSLAALDNDGGRLELFPPGKKKSSQVVEYPAMTEGSSYVDISAIASSASASTRRFLMNSLSAPSWVETMSPTPGADNEIWVGNRPPKAVFSLPLPATGTILTFDASDSIDEDGDELSFVWDFGEGSEASGETVAHMFDASGSFPVRLSVSDGLKTVTLERMFMIGPRPAPPVSIAVKAEDDEDSFDWPLARDILFPESDSEIATESADMGLLSLGSEVVVSGQVLVKPGSFGKQYFYIEPGGEPGRALKVYNYRSDFPDLELGDSVLVKGVVSGSSERYIKTSDKDGVEIFSKGEPPEAGTLTVEPSSQNLLSLVEVLGTVDKVDGRTFIELPSGGRVELSFRSGSGVTASSLPEGRSAKVIGMVLESSSRLVLAPRSPADIFIDDASGGEGGESLAAEDEKEAEGRDWVLPARERQDRTFVYLFILSLGVLAVLSGLLIKVKSKK